nr:AAA-ATPase At5g57480-like [Ipomoea trifida]
MKEFWTTLASVMGVWAFCQSLLHAVFPPELRFATVKFFHRLCSWFSAYCYYDITEIDGVNTNELYNAVQLYLSSSAGVSAGNRLSLTRGLNSSTITFGLSNNDSLADSYNGVRVVWEHVVTPRQSTAFTWRPLPEEKRGFLLRAKKKDKATVLGAYLDYVMERANEIRRKNQDRLLYTNSRGGSLDSRGHPWESVPFKHPSTFETLAMDPTRKEEIMADLKDFANGEAFYQRTGRAWKRGYLLYGPPGTGKSSMIAAMANFLGYDIYDLELTEVHTNSELRKLLMKTSSKSIIVIEDIDCSINLANRKKSGNNYGKPGRDAAPRSGRMDMHIHMSYCTFPALKILLKNYLGYQDAALSGDLEDVIAAAEMTPADISEVLIKNRRNKKAAVGELAQVLRARAEIRAHELKFIIPIINLLLAGWDVNPSITWADSLSDCSCWEFRALQFAKPHFAIILKTTFSSHLAQSARNDGVVRVRM